MTWKCHNHTPLYINPQHNWVETHNTNSHIIAGRQLKLSNQLSLPLRDDYKVRKIAKIRKRYNQVPHLTQDTTWERQD